MKRIRICFVITRLIQGGAQRVVLDVIRGLSKSRYDITLVYGSFNESEGTLLPEAEGLGVRLVKVPELQRAVHPWKDLTAFWKLYRLFCRERFHVVHTHTSKAGFLGTLAARLAGVKAVVYSPHGHIFSGSAAIRGVSGSRLKLLVFYQLRRIAERFAHKVVALTEADQAEQVALELAPAEKYVVISNGIDVRRFGKTVRPPAKLRRELSIADGCPVIGTVGRLSSEKGQRHLLEALPAIRKRFPKAMLLLVGDGPSRGELERLARRLGIETCVAFAGVRDDIPQILSAIDVFVLPSLYEAQGIALVEAMAAGRPVVATAVGGVPSVVEDGRDGILIPPCDPDAIAEAALTLAEDPGLAERLAHRAREKVLRHFTVANMVRGHDRLYGNLLDPPAGDGPGPGIVVLSPADHFHAPVVLRDLCLAFPEARTHVILTPKLGKSKAGTLRRFLRRSGLDFMSSLLAAKARFHLLRLTELACGVPFERRLFLTVGDVTSRLSLRTMLFSDVNSSDARSFIRQTRPEFIVLNLFNQIVHRELISLASAECVNIHTSLLPAYRGVAPNFWMLANGETRGGVSIHRVTTGVDDGDILAQEEISIDRADSFFSLYRRCAVAGGRLLVEVLSDPDRGAKAIPQDDGEVSYFSYVTKSAVKRFRRRRRCVFSFTCLSDGARLLREPSHGT